MKKGKWFFIVLCALFSINILVSIEIEKSSESTIINLKEVLEQNQIGDNRCNGGDFEVCFNLGKWYLDSMQLPNQEPKEKKAYSLFQKACEGNVDYCLDIAIVYRELKKGQEAKEFYALACEKNKADSCASLADLYAEGNIIKQDYQKARKFYEQTCKITGGGIFGSFCNESHIHYYKLNNSEALKKFCDEGDMRSCFELGDFVLEAKYPIKDDYLKAQALFQKACDNGERRGCYGLGMLYVSDFWTNENIAKYIPTDYKKGEQLIEKSCQAGVMIACYYTGWMIRESLGVKVGWWIREIKADSYFDAACEVKIDYACKQISGGRIFRRISRIIEKQNNKEQFSE